LRSCSTDDPMRRPIAERLHTEGWHTLIPFAAQDSPKAFSDSIMPEMERVLSKLVSLGAPQAYELEQLLYYGRL
jgi:hypothetical protein